MTNAEDIASEFLEVASEQRLSILLNLTKERLNLSRMAKLVGASAAEVHRNFGRLQKAGLIKKDADGNYGLTQYGRILCAQIPTLEFMSKNLKYFETHDFSDLPFKYIQRVGALADSQLVTGYVKVTEKCEEMYKNANKYICNILVEIPYNDRLLQILESKLRHNTHIASIFSENAIVSKDRRNLLPKFNFTKFINNGSLERRMRKDVKTVIFLNEEEAGLCFPTADGEPDISKMFYSTNVLFHEWCHDFFSDCWRDSASFQEEKLMKN